MCCVSPGLVWLPDRPKRGGAVMTCPAAQRLAHTARVSHIPKGAPQNTQSAARREGSAGEANSTRWWSHSFQSTPSIPHPALFDAAAICLVSLPPFAAEGGWKQRGHARQVPTCRCMPRRDRPCRPFGVGSPLFSTLRPLRRNYGPVWLPRWPWHHICACCVWASRKPHRRLASLPWSFRHRRGEVRSSVPPGAPWSQTHVCIFLRPGSSSLRRGGRAVTIFRVWPSHRVVTSSRPSALLRWPWPRLKAYTASGHQWRTCCTGIAAWKYGEGVLAQMWSAEAAAMGLRSSATSGSRLGAPVVCPAAHTCTLWCSHRVCGRSLTIGAPDGLVQGRRGATRVWRRSASFRPSWTALRHTIHRTMPCYRIWRPHLCVSACDGACCARNRCPSVTVAWPMVAGRLLRAHSPSSCQTLSNRGFVRSNHGGHRGSALLADQAWRL